MPTGGKKSKRLSEYYRLGMSQASLDFVDVRIVGDTALFIDPASIARIDSAWANACTSAIQSYFQRVLDAIIAGHKQTAVHLLASLTEDNSTRLGYSRTSRGSGMGRGLAEEFYRELSASRAVATGLIRDIEDTALLIDNIGEDRISDVTTNIIRGQLIDYTQQAASAYGIPLQRVTVGPVWDTTMGVWVPTQAQVPLPKKGGPILLVPKSIVRQTLTCDPGDYYRYQVLPFLAQKELDGKSPLVEVLKSGRRRVTKKRVEEKYKAEWEGGQGFVKSLNLRATMQEPSMLDDFKERRHATGRAMNAEQISDATGTPPPDYDALLDAVTSLRPGAADATKYEKAIEALLNATLYPALVAPIPQEKIHDGRKRIDISYTNAAKDGFFLWLAQNYAAANVVVEAKNYERPLANPEYDQITGRFSPSRGKVGLLIYRAMEDKQKVLASCRDAAKDDRGFVLALDDADLGVLVDEAKRGDVLGHNGLLRERFRGLTA